MAMTQYPYGNLLRLSVLFTGIAIPGAADPSVVTLQIGTPAGTTTIYTYGVGGVIQKTAIGSYYADILASEAGTWRYYWRGTGTLVAGMSGAYSVASSGF